jgi:hypothetical protein
MSDYELQIFDERGELIIPRYLNPTDVARQLEAELPFLEDFTKRLEKAKRVSDETMRICFNI